MSTERIYEAVVRVAAARSSRVPFRTHLDIGAGAGRLVTLFQQKFELQSSACDYTDKLFQLPERKVDIVDLNRQPLPYGDGAFDVVTATEVIEHLERYRTVLRDIHRVLEPGGLCILTTPNILNLNSRLRFLWFGFWNLFGPLPVNNSALYSTGGHINPVSCFYLAHALLDAGFIDLELTVDKYQRSSVPKLVLLFVPLKICGALAWRTEMRKYRTIDADNAPLVKAMNSVTMLLGRTLVVSARKPIE
jgi:SAM-dependent methyltransferase